MPTDMESTESRGLPYDVLFEDASQDYTTPLLTPNDIESREIIPNREWGANVVKIQQRFIMKFGRDVRPIEANNMLYVAKHTTIPVPRFYTIYQRKEGKKTITCILMEYIPGKSLMDLWSDIEPTCKASIARTLRTYFDELRQLKHPGHFGTTHGGPPNIHLFMQDDITGPLKSEREFVDAIIRSYAIELGPRGAQKVRYYQRAFPAIFNGDNSPVFSHSDLQRKNIMILDDGSLVIIVWEYASWSLVYWEYFVAMFCCLAWTDDWHEYVGQALDEYPNEYLWFATMHREMWC
ncbi:kinase-like domain-containing protein [Fusarium oxysporum Fo47]|uniref:Aminoglycoside phosphotransferase domain-containing protein n=1 Tax=Fusarium oxysporum Fo47 TaxID=660027 RepID=W9KXS9_FUSOX|nr:kinase-like domain-containing protein [Fusarium oxysporum Fo47]EWZ45898.1 hypothetical protein FOZG_06105 [Fusarium oxysporum Fo47]QKD51960.1 kinase-like domain-containing protein [Fusarium oxysporum Fo47]